MKEKSPCIGCTNRYPACQAKCEMGRAYAKRCKDERERIKAEKSWERTFNLYKSERVYETKKRCGME